MNEHTPAITTRTVRAGGGIHSRHARAAALLAGLLLLVGTSFGQEAPSTAVTRPADAATPATTTTAPLIADGLDARGEVRLLVNKSAVVTTRQPFERVSVGQPEVADVNVVGASSVLVTAKKPGTTQLIVWDPQGRTQVADVVVSLDVAGLQGELNAMFPGSSIEVAGINGAIALRGKVPNLQAAEQAAQLAQPYAAKVLNLLEVAGGQQVMLHVRFAEVSRNATNALGVNLGYTDGTAIGGSNIGQLAPFGFAESQVNPDSLLLGVPLAAGENVTLFGAGEIGGTAFTYFVEALRRNNLLRILAEPNLVATSGQEAEFLAGGEFPVPVPQSGSGGGTTITIEYREFGVRLKFVPVVMGDGKIRLKVSPEVSDLDFTAAVRIAGTQVPGLRKRNLTTTVEMFEGQTFALAGLLNQTVTAQRDVTPLLGDLPVIGALFRSVRYQRSETELVVLVTPRIVSALNPADVPPAPGERWRHPTEGELFWKRDLGGPVETDKPEAPDASDEQQSTGPAPRFRGQYGFTAASAGRPSGAAGGVVSVDGQPTDDH